MIVALFGDSFILYFEMPKISASISPYHKYPKICAHPFGLDGELTRAVLSAKMYVFFFVFFTDNLLMGQKTHASARWTGEGNLWY